MMPDKKEKIFAVSSDTQVNYLLDRTLRSAGYDITIFTEKEQAADSFKALEQKDMPALVILSNGSSEQKDFELAHAITALNPIQVILYLSHQNTPELLRSAMQAGIYDCLCFPLKTVDILKTVQNGIQVNLERKRWLQHENHHNTHSLSRQASELETLARLGSSITATFDQDTIFPAIVEAAVELTGAEEGSLLMVDEVTGELYMRASRNFQEQFARTFRLPVKDSLAGKVVQTGEPILLDKNSPEKIKTAYLVRRLLYVPLKIEGRVIGVLGVDNRQKVIPFTDRHVQIAIALANFAVIAIQNSRYYNNAVKERNKLETILTDVQDGVIVLDNENKIVLVNHTTRSAFNLNQNELVGQKATDVFKQPDLLKLIEPRQTTSINQREIDLADGRVFIAQLNPITDVGMVITLHDISSLKKLDKIKTEFVNTVSHDLRSPLTAILGYVELIERVGAINEIQREFIHRVQASVHNITDLVDDLLNLGQIEAGFDNRKELVQLDQIVRLLIDDYTGRANEKEIKLIVDLPNDFPPLFGNPIHIRQMVDNLFDNAIKYTPKGGAVKISVRAEGDQAILQVIDTGIGIPIGDLPYIFDKFFRANNVTNSKNGTGLGLSIVKSIVENHEGRIWVDSVINQGTKFTVILPFSKPTPQA